MLRLKVISLHKNVQKLVSKAQQNDRDAQKQLYDLFSGKMLSICRQYVNDIHHAEDVMITAFLKVFTNINSFRNEGSFEGWVRRIMVREAINFLRSQKKKVLFTDAVIEVESNDDFPVENLSINEIQQLIDELPEGYRMVFLMYAVEGYKHHEIAKTLAISVNTSKSQLFKARKMLQHKIKVLNQQEDGRARI
jgi:RNA polymerase sigma-70 factor (ECF subfamily)